MADPVRDSSAAFSVICFSFASASSDQTSFQSDWHSKARRFHLYCSSAHSKARFWNCLTSESRLRAAAIKANVGLIHCGTALPEKIVAAAPEEDSRVPHMIQLWI